MKEIVPYQFRVTLERVDYFFCHWILPLNKTDYFFKFVVKDKSNEKELNNTVSCSAVLFVPVIEMDGRGVSV